MKTEHGAGETPCILNGFWKTEFLMRIYSYAAFMIFSGIFSILAYTKGKVKSKLMQLCVAINSIYAVGAIAIIGMNIVTRING